MWLALLLSMVCASGDPLDDMEERANDLRHAGRHAEALEVSQALLDIEVERYGADSILVAGSLLFRGAIYGDMARWRESEAAFMGALAIFEDQLAPTDFRIADLCNNIGLMLHRSGDPRAKQFLERGVALWRIDDPEGEYTAIAENNLAMYLLEIGELDEAQTLFEHGLLVLQREYGVDSPLLATSFNNLAALHVARFEFEEALDLQRRALICDQAQLGPDHPAVGTSLQNYGMILLRLGRMFEVLPVYERAAEIYEKGLGAAHPQTAGIYSLIGAYFDAIGDLQASVDYHRRALDIREANLDPSHPSIAVSVSSLANAYYSLGDLDDAHTLFRRSLSLREARFGTDHPNIAVVLISLAELTEEMGDDAEAESLLLRALDVRRAGLDPDDVMVGRSRQFLGHFLLGKKRLEEAEPHLVAALEAELSHDGDPLSRRQALGSLAMLRLAQRRHDEAESLALQSFEIAQSQLIEGSRGSSEQERMLLLGRTRNALDRRMTTAGTDRDAYRALFWFKDRARQAMLSNQERVVQDGRSAELRRELASIERNLSALVLNTEPEDADRVASIEILNRRKSEAGRLLARRHATKRAPSQATFEDVCAAIPNGVTVVDVTRAKTNYAAYIYNGDCDVASTALGEIEAVERAVSRHRELLQPSTGLTFRSDAAGELVRELVWDPIADQLRDAEHVILIPDAALNGVSFAGLPTGNGRYLVESLSVSYLDSATDLLRMGEPHNSEGALVVGGVDFGPPRDQSGCLTPGFRSLPGTEVESVDVARSLKRIRGIGTIRNLSGRDAAESSVANAIVGQRIAHLATHGFFIDPSCDSDGHNAMALSGVVLAGANNDGVDGIWTAGEIASLDLRETELVVLSGCETGLGQAQSGLGVQGLRSAFSVAGVDATVMSLWSVEDEPTQQLMSRFYQRLGRRGGLRSAEALRKAQLAQLEWNRKQYEEAKPETWAAFIATGDWR